MLLKNDFGELSVFQAYPLQGSTMSCTLIVSRSLDHRTTPLNQLCTIDLPMCSHCVVFPLEWPVSHITFPYVSGLVPQTFLADAHSWTLFTRTGQDLVRLFLQLSVHSSCDHIEWWRLQTMRGLLIPLGEWFRAFPTAASGCTVSLVLSHSIYPVCALRGTLVCPTCCQVCGDGRWYYLRGPIPRWKP